MKDMKRDIVAGRGTEIYFPQKMARTRKRRPTTTPGAIYPGIFVRRVGPQFLRDSHVLTTYFFF
jgi:hypothetical protein